MTPTGPAAVGFVPAAPLLVPAVGGGSAPLDEPLRQACRAVARELAVHTARAIVVLASGPEGGPWTEAATWGFEGFGVERRPSDDRPRLPWQLGIGGWLLDDVGWTGVRRYLTDSSPPDLAADETVLVIGDGSACRSEKAPGHLDARAEKFDAGIATAIAAGDIEALGGLDPALSAELLCAGAPTWRALAEGLTGHPVVEAKLLVDAAPYGVGYFVGWWRLAETR